MCVCVDHLGWGGFFRLLGHTNTYGVVEKEGLRILKCDGKKIQRSSQVKGVYIHVSNALNKEEAGFHGCELGGREWHYGLFQ